MQFEIVIQGDKLVVEKFKKMGYAASFAVNAMNKVGLFMMEVEDEIFDYQGFRGGGPGWLPYSEEWGKRKEHEGLDLRILHAKLELRESMTKLGSPHQIFDVTPKSVNLGSTLVYADIENAIRPFTQFTPDDLREIRNIITEHLMKVWGEEAIL